MAKRKKRFTTTRKTATKKTKSEEEQPSPSTSVEDEESIISNDAVPAERAVERAAVERTVPRQELILSEESARLPETTNSSEEVPAASAIECDDIVVSLSENIIEDEEDLAPGDPGEFVFAPIVRRTEETVDLCTSTPSRSCSSSTSANEKVVSLVSSRGPTKKQNSGDGSSGMGGEVSHTRSIEIIDVDEIPDRPGSSSIGDDVIEITPGNSSHSSRSNSPEIIVSRQIVDLTGTRNTGSSNVENVPETVDSLEEEEDIYLSHLSKRHREKRKPTLIAAPRKADESEPSPRQKLNCPICMDDFNVIVKDRHLMSTSCGHVFCDVCIKAAIGAQKRCPTCRKKQLIKNLHPIFL